MTVDESIIEVDEAVCIANKSGRMLMANKRFCKLFGFAQSEIKWHYLCDLYRYKEELNRILKKVPESEETLKTRMRNRAGRSFPCLLTRRTAQSHEGVPLLVHSIQKVELAATAELATVAAAG